MSPLVLIRLGAALVLAAGLAGSHWWAYSRGIKNERTDWTAKTERAATLASERAREREKAMFRASEIANENHRAELAKARTAAAGARSELGRLRDVLAARDRVGIHTGTGLRLDGTAAERAVLLECAESYQGLAAEADRLAAQITGLQGYIINVVRPE